MKNTMITTGSNIVIRKVAISAIFLDVDAEPADGTTIDLSTSHNIHEIVLRVIYSKRHRKQNGDSQRKRRSPVTSPEEGIGFS